MLSVSKVLKEFRAAFLTKLMPPNSESFKRIYIGATAKQIYRANQLEKEHPGYKSKQFVPITKAQMQHLNDLARKLEKSGFAKYLKVHGEGSALTDGKFCNSLSKSDKNNYDFIYWDGNPIVMARKIPKSSEEKGSVKFHSREYTYDDRLDDFLEAAELLNESGYLLLCSRIYKDRSTKLRKHQIFEKLLNSKGFYINAVFQQNPENTIFHYYDSVSIITRNNNDLVFVADLKGLDDFEIKYLSKPDIKDQGTVSYFESTVPESIVKKLQRASGFIDIEDETDDRVHDEDDVYSSIDLHGHSIKEACQQVSYTINSHKADRFFHIQILHDSEQEDKDAQLKKSQILYYLRQDPRVLAYHSCPERFGGKEAVFIYINCYIVPPSITNFFLGKGIQDDERNLTGGYFMNHEEFYSLNLIRVKDKIETSTFHFYDDYEEVLLRDLADSNDEQHFELMFEKVNKEKVIENKIGKCVSILARTIETDESVPIAIVIDKSEKIFNQRGRKGILFYFEENSIGEYVTIFLNSEIGRQIFQYFLADVKRKSKISVEDLLNLKILMPKKQVLLETIKAHNKINELQQSVNEFHKGFSKNPKSTIKGRMDKLDDMLSVAGKLNKQDQIHSIIRGSEKGDAEFKASWKLPIADGINKEKEKERFEIASIRTQSMVLKVINSFVNTRGGDLIIGVEDENNKIIGLEQELKHFYSKKHKTLTKQKDEFDREFAMTLRTFFEINFIGKDKNISSEFVEMENGTLVYHVSCSPSTKPCVINKVEKGIGKKINGELKGKEYFIRKKSESLALDGQARMDYIFERVSRESSEE